MEATSIDGFQNMFKGSDNTVFVNLLLFLFHVISS